MLSWRWILACLHLKISSTFSLWSFISCIIRIKENTLVIITIIIILRRINWKTISPSMATMERLTISPTYLRSRIIILLGQKVLSYKITYTCSYKTTHHHIYRNKIITQTKSMNRPITTNTRLKRVLVCFWSICNPNSIKYNGPISTFGRIIHIMGKLKKAVRKMTKIMITRINKNKKISNWMILLYLSWELFMTSIFMTLFIKEHH